MNRLRLYAIFCAVVFMCAAVITLLVWAEVPIVGNPWPGVFWFALLACLGELLAVNLQEGAGVSVTPTSPILWSATCVLGPLPAILISAIVGVFSMLAKFICYKCTRVLDAHSSYFGVSVYKNGSHGLITELSSMIQGYGAQWQERPLGVTIQYIAAYVANMVVAVGPAGLVYHYLGGRFLIDPGPGFHVLTSFVLPFFGLVAASGIVDLGVWVLHALVVNPVPGAKGVYGLLLTMKLALIEVGLPIVRPQLFMLVVAIALSYLYIHIHVLGFIIAATPVLALRDFFNQWVAEREAYVNTITTLATYMQHYHPYTRGHLKRVADLAERLAREMQLPAESVRYISTAAFLHDIGKIGVSEEILDKTAKLTDEEWEKIKEHPVKGAEIISHLEFLDSIVDWIKYHHKWHNGGGYPATNGVDIEIPIEAAIIAAVDAFDAMTDDRELAIKWECDSCGYQPGDNSRPPMCPKCGAEKRRLYREPKTLDQAVDELRRGAGSQFHPKVIKAFLAMLDRDGVHFSV